MRNIAHAIVLLFLLSGCVNTQYRKTPDSCTADPARLNTCPNASYIKLPPLSDAPQADLSFVEFDKDGKVFDSVLVGDTLNKIESLNASAGPNGLLMVVFIHGWNHNAAPVDGNVESFGKFLQSVAEDEANLGAAKTGTAVGKPRKVIGIYVGWQGYAAKNKLLRFLSFGNKKELSLRTGYPGVQMFLRQLASIRGSNASNRLVTIGHSFGSGVLFSAIQDDLLNDIKGRESPAARYDAPYGDLAILLNPAVEAGRFLDLEHMQKSCGVDGSALRMASFTSEGDEDLSGAFPLGMKVFYPFSLARYGDAALMKTPFGLYEQWIQYRLDQTDAEKAKQPLTAAQFSTAASQWKAFRHGDGPLTFPGVKVSLALDTGSPLLKSPAAISVRVDRTLIGDHNDIWQSTFTNFMRYFIGLRFSRSLASELEGRAQTCGPN